MQNIHIILPVLALVFGAVAIIKLAWPLCAVAVILLSVNALVK